MNGSFQRKVTYLALIAALLVPLALIGRPAASNTDGGESAGGKLASLRADYHLGQAQIGKIDPTSSAVRYVSLGLHGVAVCVLHNKADHYQRQEDWITLMAVLNQLTYLQPNYVKVWSHQSWNISYNISSKLDDYREKYDWVIRGFKLLRRGMAFNELEPLFPYEMGWSIGHKIGQDDHRVAFRRIFRDDRTNREALVPLDAEFDAAWTGQTDNWLYAKRYVQYAHDMVDHRGAILRMGPENFYSRTAMHQKSYAEALEAEGTFGEKAKLAWRQVHDDLNAFKRREFPSVYGYTYRLDDLEEQIRRRDEAKELLARVPAEQVELAQQLSQEIAQIESQIHESRGTIKQWNVEYWLQRSELEQTPDALAAREAIYNALRDADDRPLEARAAFEEAFRRWRAIWNKYPETHDDQTAEDMYRVVNHYLRVLRTLNVRFDRDKFPLVELYDQGLQLGKIR